MEEQNQYPHPDTINGEPPEIPVAGEPVEPVVQPPDREMWKNFHGVIRREGFENRNKIIIMCMSHDIDDCRWVDIFRDAIDSGVFVLPNDMNEILKRNPVPLPRGDQITLLASKYKILALADYFEQALDCIEPLVNRRNVRVIGNSTRIVVALPGAQFGGMKRVLVVFGEELNNYDQGFFVYEAMVHQRRDGVLLLIGHNSPDDRNFDDTRDVTVFKMPNVQQLEDRLHGVKSLLDNEHVQQKLFPVYATAAQYHLALDIPGDENLNEFQRIAIREMLNLDSNHAFVLWGPPGTGKTVTVTKFVETIYTHVKGPAVLICSSTNASCDVITERLVASQIIPNEHIRRVMARARDPDMVSDAVKSVSFLVEGTFAKIPNLHRYKVVICTIGSSSKLDIHSDEKKNFTHVIFEEAGQIPEYDTLVPLSIFCDAGTRVYFAGDHEQLAPIVLNAAVSRLGHDVVFPTIKRLARLLLYRTNPRYMVTLLQNYRSNLYIMRMYSKLTYEERLIPSENVALNSLMSSAILDRNKIPIRWHICIGDERRHVLTKSIVNRHEALIVLSYVQKVITEGVELDDIGIISPYVGQCEEIEERLARENITGIHVGTVEAFQGLEKRVIIASLVRTNGLGFMQDRRRLNTIISRAKCMLIIIGNPFNFIQSNLGGQFNYCLRFMRLLKQSHLFFSTDTDLQPSLVETCHACIVDPIEVEPANLNELEDRVLTQRSFLN